MEDIPVEEAILTGVAHDRSEAKVTVSVCRTSRATPRRCSARSPTPRSTSTWCCRTSPRSETGKTDITFTLPKADGPRAVEFLTARQPEIGFSRVLYDDHIGKVSLVGAGMSSHPGVTATFCEALAEVGVNIDLISTSEIRISVLVKDTELDDAVGVLHEAFELGGDEMAVVYAGTGR